MSAVKNTRQWSVDASVTNGKCCSVKLLAGAMAKHTYIHTFAQINQYRTQ